MKTFLALSLSDDVFIMLINVKMPTIAGILTFMSRISIYHANKCLNASNCWHFNIYEQDKFHAQLKRHEKA